MSERRLFIDRGPGETRGVILLDGRPERLLIERAGEAFARVGDRFAARVVQVDRIGSLAFVDMAGEPGVVRLKAERPPPVQGALLEVEVTVEAQRGKAAVVRASGEAEGDPRRMSDPQTFEQRLQAFAPRAKIDRGPDARDVADEAETLALDVVHPLAVGGSVAVEPTRALVAVDVDLGARSGVGGETKKAARQANLAAIYETARLLRLKGLGGLVIIDLIGHSHDGPAMATAAKIAFAPENPGVVIGPITRFGTLELTVPQRGRPVSEILLGEDGRPTAATVALRLLRGLEREGRADGGARLVARCAADVAEAAEARAEILADRIGRRFTIAVDAALARADFQIGRP